MEPRDISETQKMRALAIGIKPVLIKDENKKVYRTNRGCRVVTQIDSEGEHVTLSCTGVHLICVQP